MLLLRSRYKDRTIYRKWAELSGLCCHALIQISDKMARKYSQPDKKYMQFIYSNRSLSVHVQKLSY
jgi:hypothetical protein